MLPTLKEISTSAGRAKHYALKTALVQGRARYSSRPASSKRTVASQPQGGGNGAVVVRARELNDRPDLQKERNKKRQQWRTNTRTSTTGSKLASNITKHKRTQSGNVDAVQFVNTFRREVGQFGSKALDKKRKRAYQTDELVKLGCRPPKNKKMPIGVLQEERRKEKERAAEEKELQLASGMLVRSKRR